MICYIRQDKIITKARRESFEKRTEPIYHREEIAMGEFMERIKVVT